MQQETRTDPQKRDMEEEEMTTQEAINQLNKMAVTDRDYEAVNMVTDSIMHGGWISVKDRLPDTNQSVLGWYKDNPFSGYAVEVVSWNGKGWVFVYAQRYVTNVTHWMPLPRPPKEE